MCCARSRDFFAPAFSTPARNKKPENPRTIHTPPQNSGEHMRRQYQPDIVNMFKIRTFSAKNVVIGEKSLEKTKNPAVHIRLFCFSQGSSCSRVFSLCHNPHHPPKPRDKPAKAHDHQTCGGQPQNTGAHAPTGLITIGIQGGEACSVPSPAVLKKRVLRSGSLGISGRGARGGTYAEDPRLKQGSHKKRPTARTVASEVALGKMSSWRYNTLFKVPVVCEQEMQSRRKATFLVGCPELVARFVQKLPA